jgi:hypothetical protein
MLGQGEIPPLHIDHARTMVAGLGDSSRAGHERQRPFESSRRCPAAAPDRPDPPGERRRRRDQLHARDDKGDRVLRDMLTSESSSAACRGEGPITTTACCCMCGFAVTSVDVVMSAAANPSRFARQRSAHPCKNSAGECDHAINVGSHARTLSSTRSTDPMAAVMFARMRAAKMLHSGSSTGPHSYTLRKSRRPLFTKYMSGHRHSPARSAHTRHPRALAQSMGVPTTHTAPAET